jgi:uncharacterized protein (TIGR02284 family)
MDDVINPLMPPNLGAFPDADTNADAAAQHDVEAQTSDVLVNENLNNSLTHLIKVLHETEETYRQASERVSSSWLQSLFAGYSSQRTQFITELSNLSSGLGVMPEGGATVGDVLHQAWEDLKAAVVGVSGDDADVLAECESSEDVAKEAYEKEILKGLPPHVHDVVQLQYQEIMKAHDQVRELRDSVPR